MLLSYCDGIFICVCGLCNPPVSREASVLSRAAAAHFRLRVTNIIAGKVFIGYLLGRALKASVQDTD